MKRLFIIALMLIMATAVWADTYSITPRLLNQDPDPVEPGSYVDIRFKIENAGTGTADNVSVELVTEYPFLVDPGVDTMRNIGKLLGLQSDDQAAIVKYRVRVAEDAVEGTNKVTLRYKNEGDPWQEKEFDISVEPVDLTVSIENVVTTPSIVAPGKEAIVQITVKNLGESLVKDLGMMVDLGMSTLTTSQASLVSAGATSGTVDLVLPFAPVNSATQKNIKSLSPGASYTFQYTILTYPDAESKIYRIPLQLTYNDEAGNEYTRIDLMGVIVGKEPGLSVWLDGTEIEKAGTKGEVDIKIVNKDVTDIKFLSVIIEETDDFQLHSSEEVYLGNVDSDDYETAEFEIFVESGVSSPLMLPLTIEYKDANNNEYTLEKQIEVDLFSDEELKELSPGSGNSYIGIIIVVVVVIVGFLFYRSRRKKH